MAGFGLHFASSTESGATLCVRYRDAMESGRRTTFQDDLDREDVLELIAEVILMFR